MNRTSQTRNAWRMFLVLVFGAAAIAALILSLVFGSAQTTLAQIWHTLWSPTLSDTNSLVIWNIRFPRNIVAALVGSNLAVAGAILQAVMKNPLADPQIVGVSSGAGLAGVIVLILFPYLEYAVPFIAFIGALTAAILVYALAWNRVYVQVVLSWLG